MYEIILKNKKAYNPYPDNKNSFFYTPPKIEKESISLVISCKIVNNLSRDMEKMTNLMVKSIFEGISNGK